MPHRHASLCAAAVALFICFSPESIAAQAKIAPCSLLTPAEIRQVLGLRTAAGLSDRGITPGDPTSRCTFAGQFAAAVVVVQIHDNAKRYPPKRLHLVPIHGLGFPALAGLGSVYLLKRATYAQVTISYAGGSRVASAAQLTALARLVAARFP
jgi:hypothetical protein